MGKLIKGSEEFFESFTLGNLLGGMARGKIDFSREAVELMSVDKFSRASIGYLKGNAKDKGILEQLERACVSPRLREELEQAKKEIRERIEDQ